jgi:hypothetical protein
VEVAKPWTEGIRNREEDEDDDTGTREGKG